MVVRETPRTITELRLAKSFRCTLPPGQDEIGGLSNRDKNLIVCKAIVMGPLYLPRIHTLPVFEDLRSYR